MSETLTIDPTGLQPGDVVLELTDREEGGCHCDVKVSVRRSSKLCPPCRTGAHHNHQTEIMDHEPCRCPQSSCKYTEQQLSDALDLVKNPKGWKMPISKLLTQRQVDDVTEDLISSAISFFTGSLPEIFPEPGRPGYIRVEASGYYACIGS
jgi:hypothetical protein